MTCDQCKYHSYIANTHFCDSRNHKRRTVRISQEDAEKDMDCYWADKERRPFMTDEQTKQAILGFAEFFKGITGNQNLEIPKDMAEKYGIQINKEIADKDGEE